MLPPFTRLSCQAYNRFSVRGGTRSSGEAGPLPTSSSLVRHGRRIGWEGPAPESSRCILNKMHQLDKQVCPIAGATSHLNGQQNSRA
jgi:hypothetical protein